MTIHKSYSEARASLASLLDEATENRETVIITRRGRPSAALIAADELASLEEAAYLLRSPRNAARLLAALQRSLRSEGETQTVESLRAELGLAQTR